MRLLTGSRQVAHVLGARICAALSFVYCVWFTFMEEIAYSLYRFKTGGKSTHVRICLLNGMHLGEKVCWGKHGMLE